MQTDHDPGSTPLRGRLLVIHDQSPRIQAPLTEWITDPRNTLDRATAIIGIVMLCGDR